MYKPIKYKTMATRKVYVNATVRLIIEIEEGISVDNVMCDMDYDFTAPDETASVIDTEITDWNIIDSK